MNSVEELKELLTKPSKDLLDDSTKIDGDIMILGVNGKMGPTLAKLAKNAFEELGQDNKVIGVSRFSTEEGRKELEEAGIHTIAADLLIEGDLQSLPDVENVILMAGNKFGTKGNEHFTWAMNTYLPGRIAEKFKNSNIVAFSSGNVYPLTDVRKNKVTEDFPVDPVGEYAQSCLGRERNLTYFSHKYKTPMLLFRLNYAIDLRYGVLLEIGQHVYKEKPIDLAMGNVNVIWQGDANEYALRSLLHVSSPPKILNVTGPETLSVRWLAHEFAKRFKLEAIFEGEEDGTALLNNASQAHKLFGYPKVPVYSMIDMVADWIKREGPVYDKPTHFQERRGDF